MSIQRCVFGTVTGGITLFVLGYLLYGLALADFFAANAGSATGVDREPFDFIALGAGQFVWGGLLTMVLGWNKARTAGEGAKIGALLGLLFFLGTDLTMYATMNIANLTATLADPIVAAVLFALTGGVIVPVLGKGERPATAPAKA